MQYTILNRWCLRPGELDFVPLDAVKQCMPYNHKHQHLPLIFHVLCAFYLFSEILLLF